jgi:flagellar motor switch protein FliG
MATDNQQDGFVKETLGAKGYRKAAHFLMLMNKDDAANVLRHLSPDEIEKITKEIALTKDISSEEAEKVLMEFGFKRDKGIPLAGGAETAKEMLIKAFGEEKGETLFKKAVPHGGLEPFEFLNDYEVHQLKSLLKNESEYVLGIILSHINPRKASELLKEFPLEVQRKVVMHIAKMKKIDNSVIERMEETLREKIRKQGKVTTHEISGTDTLAGILKYMDLGGETAILGALEEVDPRLSTEIKEKLFSLDDVLNLYDKDLQKVLREFGEEELAVILKGKSEQVKERFFSSVSVRRRKLIEEEIDHLGPRKKSEVDEATKEFLDYIRGMVEDGTIVLDRERSV